MPLAQKIANYHCPAGVKMACSIAVRLLLFPAAAVIIGSILNALTQ